MRLYTTKEPIVTSSEYDGEDGFLAANEKDLDLAKKVEPSLVSQDDGTYTDGQFIYYSVMAEIEVRSVRENWHKKQVWARSYMKCYPGGHWDPDDYDEVRAEDEVFLSLSDAVKQTKLDGYKIELELIDNTCYACDGSGLENPLADEGPVCPKCGGEGFI